MLDNSYGESDNQQKLRPDFLGDYADKLGDLLSFSQQFWMSSLFPLWEVFW